MMLQDWLANSLKGSLAKDVGAVILAIAGGAEELRSHLDHTDGRSQDATLLGQNSSGDGQKGLDVLANDIFVRRLRSSPVRVFGSEEADDEITLSSNGTLYVAMDPLDGSGNIDINMPIGTIFGIMSDCGDEPAESCSGADQIAAGFIVYGIVTEFILCVGDAPELFILSDRGFELVPGKIKSIPRVAKTIAANTSNLARWSAPLAEFVQGRFATGANMRWTGSLVAEARRILTDGGLLLYPADARPGYEAGRLRLVYEANPIAWIVERAGGKATNGVSDILTLRPTSLHQRVPLIFGAADDVLQLVQEISAAS